MKRILFLLIAVVLSINGFGQTGIQTTNVLDNVALQVDSDNKGVLVPRLSTAQRDALQVSAQPVNEGLIIYNTDENCINYYSWELSQWQSVCGYSSRANFTVECSSITINGNYKSSSPLDNTHFIDLVVEVTIPGVYDIGIRPVQDNGYYFALKGEFVTTGRVKLRLPSFGSPTKHGIDQLAVFLNGSEQTPACPSLSVNVLNGSITADFVMDCSSIQVNGLYKVDQSVDASNSIEFYVDVQSSAIGATYEFSTNMVNGIYFSGGGTLTQSRQLITLQASGMPNTTLDIKLELSSNSVTSVKTCPVVVEVAKSSKKILLYGDSSKSNNITNLTSKGHLLLTSANNFGMNPNSTVKMESWDLHYASGTYNFSTNLSKNNNPPDIVFIHGDIPDTNSNLTAFLEYLVNGGVVIYITNERSFLTKLTSKLVNLGAITPAVSQTQNASVYSFPGYAITPISGKFAELFSKHWGSEGDLIKVLSPEIPEFYTFSSQVDESIYVTPTPDPPTPPEGTDPEDDQQPSLPESNNPPYASMYLSKAFSLFWIGQENFISSTQTSGPQAFVLDAQNRPIAQSNFGHDVKFTVYNSAFLANLIQWAIEESEKNGINK